ncbi:MAG TPA: hypothetical protein VL899_03585 [Alphaproteobacteria bacterium]|nr:hypothetical protein [Alphaproteobacteria bacterium]
MRAAGKARAGLLRALMNGDVIRSAIGAGAILAALAAGLPASAEPVATHPRMWVTAADLPKLRNWAVDSNPMYKKGLALAAAQAKANADAAWNWTSGKPDLKKWQDDGSTGYVFDCTEAYAQMFAFMSLVDPNAANRKEWASHARIMLMWVINQAALGFSSNQPFRDRSFPAFNRANYWGEAFGLTVDWIYGSLSTSDKAQIRKVFMLWDDSLLTASTAGEEHPQPVGILNSKKLLGIDSSMTAYSQQLAQIQMRWAANNYDLGHLRMLALTSMAFDAADDPLVDPHKATLAVGNSLRSYFADATGAWLYQTYAMFEDAATVRQKLKLGSSPNLSLGIASAGPPVEGSLYGESLGFLGETLLAMRSAGYDDTASWGPQAGFFGSAYWDKAVDGFIHQIAPASYVPASESYLGHIWPIASYGDILRAWAEPDSTLTLAATVGIGDLRLGNNPDRVAKTRWIAKNVAQGGPSMLYDRAANVWGNSDATISILYFLLFGPGGLNPADPRPDMPTKFVGPSIGTISARTDWTTNATWFTFRCSWETINHQSGDCGQFQLFRKGKWLVKEWGNYAVTGLGYTSLYHNIMGIQNNTPTNLNSLYDETVAYGSQWNNDGNNGDAAVKLSVNDNWAYAMTDAAVLYNHPDYYTPSANADSVTGASRSIVWVAPDYVLAYDRATTNKANLFKQLNLTLTATPKVTGNTARAVIGDQAVTVQSLMPEGATISEQHFWKTSPSQEMDLRDKSGKVTETGLIAELEPSRDRLLIDATGKPKDARFLTFIQGTDKDKSAAVATAIHSTAGAKYDGAYVGDVAVLFPVTVGEAVKSFSYSVPSKVTRQLITGLVPGKKYSLAIALLDPDTPATITVAEDSSAPDAADAGGVIGFGFATSKTPTLVGSVAGFRKIGP